MISVLKQRLKNSRDEKTSKFCASRRRFSLFFIYVQTDKKNASQIQSDRLIFEFHDRMLWIPVKLKNKPKKFAATADLGPLLRFHEIFQKFGSKSLFLCIIKYNFSFIEYSFQHLENISSFNNYPVPYKQMKSIKLKNTILRFPRLVTVFVKYCSINTLKQNPISTLLSVKYWIK